MAHAPSWVDGGKSSERKEDAPQVGGLAAEPGDLSACLPVGRLVEFSGAAGRGRTTAAVGLVVRAQAAGEVVAWIQGQGGALYPPDLAESGVDLASMIVVNVPLPTRSPGAPQHAPQGALQAHSERYSEGFSQESPEQGPDHAGAPRRAPRHRPPQAQLARAAELLLRSGAFGLVVIDLVGLGLGSGRGAGWQSRLDGLAREHGCRVVLLTDSAEGAASAGPLVMVRIETRRERCGPGRFLLMHEPLRNKTPQAQRPTPDRHRAPRGLP